MEVAVVVGVIAISAILLIWRLARKAGIGLDRPDCGCGHCAEKRKESI